MPELREVFEMVTKQTEPDLDSWKEQQDRQRRTARNRKIGGIAAVAAIVSALVLVFALTRPSEETGKPAHTGPGGGEPTLTPGLNPQDRIVVGLDGATTGTVTVLPEDAFGLDLSSDGATIAFVTEVDGENHVATIGFDGTGLRLLGPGTEPALSPDGSRIAFVLQDDVYVMNADGSAVRKLTGSPHVDEFPQWSPDGTTIVYDNFGSQAPESSGLSPSSSIMTIPSGGGTPTKISRNPDYDAEPAFSPDGSQIAFLRGLGRGVGLWVMDANGGYARPLTQGGGVLAAPRWSPDGTKIAFTQYTVSWRADLHLGVNAGDWPVELVRIIDVQTSEIRHVGGLAVATFWNAPQWMPSGHALLISAVHQD